VVDASFDTRQWDRLL